VNKSIINNQAVDVNKIMPLKYPWAIEHYQNGVAISWIPEEVSMATDIAQWRSGEISDDEKRMILYSIGYFSTAESLVSNNIILSIFRFVTNAEARVYLLRQAYEEANHTMSLVYVIESLDLPEDEVYNAYKNIKSIEAKDADPLMSTADIADPSFSTNTTEGIQEFLDNLVMFYVCTEGISFYSGFAMMFYMRRHNKMKGVAEIYEWISKDETNHMAFGLDLINTIKAENPQAWTPKFQERVVQRIKDTVELERAYALDAIPNGLLGLSAEQFGEYAEYIADRRLERLGLPRVYFTKNPFPWMSESVDIKKEANFFERRVTDYQKASHLEW
jgi:ribonucleoside-diphosphate reductase beta chain